MILGFILIFVFSMKFPSLSGKVKKLGEVLILDPLKRVVLRRLGILGSFQLEIADG